MNEKTNKLKLLIKQAIREVLKEELSVIIKEVMTNTAKLVNINENQVRAVNSNLKKANHLGRSSTPASQRVFLEEPINSGDEYLGDVMLSPIMESAAKKISTGKFDTKSLSEFVSIGPDADPDFADIGDDAVDNLINSNFSIR